MRRIASEVTSAGVPCGRLIEAMAKSASMSGMKMNRTMPLATIPSVTISMDRPIATVR